jgi:serine/threonine protein phosphatase PrpC
MEDFHVYYDGWGRGQKRKYGRDDEPIPISIEIEFAAVFDGHGGHRVSELLSKYYGPAIKRHVIDPRIGRWRQELEQYESMNVNDIALAIKRLHLELDEEICRGGTKGGACSIATLRIHDHVFLINLGDSRAMLIDNHDEPQVIAETEDMTPDVDDEYDRIVLSSEGGFVAGTDVRRVNGVVRPSRSFGDNLHGMKMKSALIVQDRYLGERAPMSPIPMITHCRLLPNRRHMLLLACDGVWDVESLIGKQRIVQIAAQGHCRELVDAAIAHQTGDNVSVLTCPLFHQRVSSQRPHPPIDRFVGVYYRTNVADDQMEFNNGSEVSSIVSSTEEEDEQK